ncbi:MAG: toll/interleukin-1 receptor domain-containing protein [Oscillospiraceae bacterium]
MDVFISFSTKDETVAREICDTLSDNGISAWMCKSKIQAGDRWAAEIPAALESCKLFLLIVSKNSVESENVPKEVNMALERKMRIIPFKIDNCRLKGELYYYISNIHYIQSGFGQAKYTELVDTLKSCLGKPVIQDNSTHVTNHINNISLKNIICLPQIRLPNRILSGVIALALLVVVGMIAAGLMKNGAEKNSQQAASQAAVTSADIQPDAPLSTSPESPLSTSPDPAAAAFAPADITPYQLPDNRNYYKEYNAADEQFKMGGVVYKSGFSLFSRESPSFSFNLSDKGYTKLHFKAGHVDGSGTDTQYILIYADDSEIYRREISCGTLPEECDISIDGAKKLTFEVRAADYGASVGITDVVFYNGAQYTPEFGAAPAQKSCENSPSDLLPFEYGDNCNSYRVFSDSLKKDDFFTMGGEKYTSGYTAAGKYGGEFYFNVADKGFTNLSLVSGCADGSDSVTQYMIIYADGKEIFRKEIAPGDLPCADNIDITGARVVKLDFECPDAGLGVSAAVGLTDVVFYNSALYTPDAGENAVKVTHLNSPKDIMPYKKSNSTAIYNDSLKKDDFFTMGGVKYTSGYKVNGKVGEKIYFNVSDMGFTDLHLVSGCADGSDDVTQYMIIYADGKEIFRKENASGDLPCADNVDITGARVISIEFLCPDAGLGVFASTGVTDVVFYNKNEYTP